MGNRNSRVTLWRYCRMERGQDVKLVAEVLQCLSEGPYKDTGYVTLETWIGRGYYTYLQSYTLNRS